MNAELPPFFPQADHLSSSPQFSNYDLEGYDNAAVLPKGYAALLASACGIAGAVLGMSQTWFVGPIGALIGPPPCMSHSPLALVPCRADLEFLDGADIGFELSGSLAAITYPLFRYVEKRYLKR